jgi:RNA polymerase sigma factor (sigma-70 family)
LDRQSRDIAKLLEAEGRGLYALLLRLTLREDAAEELLQELVVRLCDSEGFAAADDPAAYAYRSAAHLAFDWRRARKRRPGMASLEVDPPAASPSALAQLVDAEDTERILDAVARLDEPYREAFVMRWIQEQPYEAIAPHLKRTPHQVRGLCHKALQQLRAWLAKEDCHVER